MTSEFDFVPIQSNCIPTFTKALFGRAPVGALPNECSYSGSVAGAPKSSSLEQFWGEL
jgi:hypothetical protein